jgi:hypothetical protein
MQTARRLYLYLLAGIGLGVLVAGVSLLLTTLFQALGLDAGYELSGGQAVRERLTLATAMSAVALPVWLIHWFLAERGVRPGRPDADVERSSAMRGLYFALVLGGLLIAMFASASALVEYAVQSLVGDAPEFRDPAGDLGRLLATSAAWGYHLRVRIRDWRIGSISGAGAWLPRAYLYLATFAGLFLLLFGIADLLSLVSRLLIGAPDPTFDSGQEWWSYPLATALSRILVGGAAWIGHWWYANRLWADTSERGAIERPASLRFVYFVAVLVVASASSIGFLGQGLSGVLDAAFGRLDNDNRVIAELIATLLAATLFAIAWRIHAGWLRGAAAEPGGPGHLVGERLVTYPTAIVGLAFGAVGIGRLLGELFETLFGGGQVVVGGQLALEIVADFVPYGLLGIGVWLWQWSRVTRARRADPIGEGASTVRRAALLLVLAVSVLAGVAALGTILYQLFGTLFGVDPQGDLGVPLGALITALAVAAYHGQLLRHDAGAREAVAVAEPSTVGAPATTTPDELPLVLVAPTGTDPAELTRVRRAMEEQLPDGYRLRDDRRMS